VYSFEGCASCHGGERQGTRSAPPLARLRRHWSADELTRYLRHPGAYPKDRRLRRVADRFPAEMAGLPAADPGRLRDLVAYLLSP
jgi:cytochrome c2